MVSILTIAGFIRLMMILIEKCLQRQPENLRGFRNLSDTLNYIVSTLTNQGNMTSQNLNFLLCNSQKIWSFKVDISETVIDLLERLLQFGALQLSFWSTFIRLASHRTCR